MRLPCTSLEAPHPPDSSASLPFDTGMRVMSLSHTDLPQERLAVLEARHQHLVPQRVELVSPRVAAGTAHQHDE